MGLKYKCISVVPGSDIEMKAFLTIMVSLDKDFINFFKLDRTFEPVSPRFIQKNLSPERGVPQWIWQ